MKLSGRPLVGLAFLTAAAIAQSQTIYDVVNYGSRIGTGLPSSGIAQGSLFAVIGSGVGPAQMVQAAFPLPAASGLAGVTVSLLASDGSPVNAILVAASAGEVDAILPSATPLGPATLTLNNNGSTANWTITVVAAAFGIMGGAGIYNVNPDGSTSLNTNFQSAQPGQIVILNGTGLGAIQSDETQFGATDVPSTAITIWVGTQQATLVSAGRGICCSGIDPNFPIPQGVAGWDVLAFFVPAGVSGCQVSVAVQTPGSVSNLTSFSVAAAGGTCPEAAAVNSASPILLTGLSAQGTINMMRSDIWAADGSETKTDQAQAFFVATDYGSAPVAVPSYLSTLGASPGSCYVTTSRVDGSIMVSPAPPPSPPSYLDAGFALNLTASRVNQLVPKDGTGQYSAVSSVASFAQPGPPSVFTGGPSFLPAGYLRLDNGGGGADVGAFQEILRNPTPVSWDSMDTNLIVNRSQGITVTWSGGDIDGVLSIGGTTSLTAGSVTYTGTFGCTALVSAGTFVVPAFVTSQMPASAAGQVSLTEEITQSLLDIPGINVAYSISRNTTSNAAVWQ